MLGNASRFLLNAERGKVAEVSEYFFYISAFFVPRCVIAQVSSSEGGKMVGWCRRSSETKELPVLLLSGTTLRMFRMSRVFPRRRSILEQMPGLLVH